MWKLARGGVDQDELAYALKRTLPAGEAAPGPKQIDSAVRFLARRGYLAEHHGQMNAIVPDEGGGIDADALSRRVKTEKSKLRRMVSYAYHDQCRRQYILSYFGDQSGAGEGCGGCDVCTGQVMLAPPAPGSRRTRTRAARSQPGHLSETSCGPPCADTMERLRAFRSRTAAAESLPAYCVFSNRTLEELARSRPSDMASLAAVHGIGDGKLQKYGTAILAELRSPLGEQP